MKAGHIGAVSLALCAAAGATRFEEAFIKLAGEGVR